MHSEEKFVSREILMALNFGFRRLGLCINHNFKEFKKSKNEFLDKVGGNRNSILTDVTIGYDFHVRSRRSN